MNTNEDDDIATPSTSRSSSINELEERPSILITPPTPIEEINHPESSLISKYT